MYDLSYRDYFFSFNPAPALPSLDTPLAFCSISAISKSLSFVFLLKLCCRDNVYCCHIILLLSFFFVFCTLIFITLPCLFFVIPFVSWKCLMLLVIVSTNFSFFCQYGKVFDPDLLMYISYTHTRSHTYIHAYTCTCPF